MGQVRWPKGPPHFALNSPLFVFFVFLVFAFLSLLLTENPVFPLKRAFFVYLCLPLFLFSLFWPPPLSLSLYLSLSCYFLSSFLPVSHVSFWFCFLILFCLLLVSRFYFVFVILFRIIILDLFCIASCFIVVVVFCFCCCFFILSIWLPIKTSLKHWILQKKQNEKCRNMDILTRAVSTGVLINSVFFLFVFL